MQRRMGALLAVGLLSVVATVWSPITSGMPAATATPVEPGSAMSDITSAPVRPPLCTDEQIAAVDLDNCALMFDGTPTDHGFPAPPFPGNRFVLTPLTAEEWTPLKVGSSGPIVTLLQEKLKATTPLISQDGKFGSQTATAVRTAQQALGLTQTGVVDAATAAALDILVRAEIGTYPPEGFAWTGNDYNGSPALAAWEKRLVRGTVRTDPIASALFEGFLADLRRGTYRIDQAGTYAFRCTASSVRNCKGIGMSHLSYHAWGLAVDVNYTANPLQMVYHSSDACSANVKMNIPDWILTTAQHWGMFWGGWYSCPKDGQRSVVKDPHHFEFRGTPETAAAIIAKNTAEGAARAWVPELEDLLLSCGDRGASVLRIRELLPEAYRPAEVASAQTTFTATLAAAVARWQTDNDLPATGAFDTATATALGLTVRHTEVFPVLHLNSCGAAVRALQTKLGIEPTGTFGTGTMNALRSWQTAKRLAPTGVTDTRTAEALGLRLATPVPPDPDPGTSGDPATSTTGPPALRAVVPLAYGARNASVSALQRALTARGYRTPVTGRFGPTTLRNLRAFQSANRLRRTSSLSLATAQLLGLAPVPRLPARYGQTGEHIRLVQQALRDRGANLAVDGRFGTATRRAVVEFQRSVGLRVTALVDRETARALGW